MKMQLDLNGPSPPLIIHGLKTLIEDGTVETLEITGDSLSNATAIGKLLNIDPSILASSQDVPLVIDLDHGNAAYATFSCVRFLDNQRLLDWLDMVQTGTFRNAPDIEPSTEVLPRLRPTESNQ